MQVESPAAAVWAGEGIRVSRFSGRPGAVRGPGLAQLEDRQSSISVLDLEFRALISCVLQPSQLINRILVNGAGLMPVLISKRTISIISQS